MYIGMLVLQPRMEVEKSMFATLRMMRGRNQTLRAGQHSWNHEDLVSPPVKSIVVFPLTNIVSMGVRMLSKEAHHRDLIIRTTVTSLVPNLK